MLLVHRPHLRTSVLVSELRVTSSSQLPHLTDEDVSSERDCLPQGPTAQDASPCVFATHSAIKYATATFRAFY